MTVPAAHARLEGLGTYLHLAVRRPAVLTPAVRLLQQVVADVDATCSRFREDSDLSRANRSPGRWVAVDPLLVAATAVACDVAAHTGGLVNPLLGRTLVELGYDRDFGSLAPVAPTSPVDMATTGEVPDADAWRDIGLDPDGAIRLPAGTALDLGSTGKAWTADLAAAAIGTELGEPCLVSVGGDVRVVGGGRPWSVGLSERPDGPVQEQVLVGDGGLATSSTLVRRWSHERLPRHHIVDPRTGGPAEEVWRTVTATGASCVAANTASTAAVVLGRDATGWLEQRRVAARLVRRHGGVVVTGGWPAPPAAAEAGA